MKRNTWQREAVRTALSTAEGFVSAQALHGALRDSGSTIGLATVYRALTVLGFNLLGDGIRGAVGNTSDAGRVLLMWAGEGCQRRFG